MKFLNKINLKINEDFYDRIKVKQNDTARYLLFNLLDNGVPFSLENKTVRVYGLKPDGTKVFNNLTIINAAKGLAELQLTTQMLVKPGCLKLELVIYEATDILSTTKFDIDIISCIRDDGAIESTNEFSALTLGLSKLDEWDKYFKETSGAIEEKYTERLNGIASSLEETKVQVESKAENTRVDSLENDLNNLSIKNDIIITVGDNEDFSSLNQALEFLSLKRKQYGKNGVIKARIVIKTGFIMKEQILLDGVDLSWIEISSEDDEVIVQRESLSTLFSIDNGMSAYPLFGAKKNSSLPMINVLFNMNETGSPTNRHGFFIADNSSVYIRPGKGCKNAGGMGINVINGSRALGFGGVFDGAKNHGCSCFRGSYLNIRTGSAKNCGACGIYFGSSSKVVALGADFSGATEHGIWCYNLGQIDIRDGKVDNCGKYGIYAMHGTIISAGGISGTNCYLGGVLAEDGAFVELHGANISGSTGGSGIVANTGARINATGATINNNKNDGATLTSSYGNFANAIIEGNGRGGIWANRGSEVTADNCKATNGTDKAFKVTYSSVIKCPNSVGEFAIAQNTITTAGLIMSNRA